MVISVLITCVASEYGVGESLFTSNDPNMMGTPEELEGLSCCVGTIFGPLPKELHVHFTSIEQRRQVGDSHHNPARFAERKDFEDYFSSFTLATRNRSLVAGDSLAGSLTKFDAPLCTRQIRWSRGARYLPTQSEKKDECSLPAKQNSRCTSKGWALIDARRQAKKNYEST